jgi:hypothetical protein
VRQSLPVTPALMEMLGRRFFLALHGEGNDLIAKGEFVIRPNLEGGIESLHGLVVLSQFAQYASLVGKHVGVGGLTSKALLRAFKASSCLPNSLSTMPLFASALGSSGLTARPASSDSRAAACLPSSASPTATLR